MGYRPKTHKLELASYQSGDPDESLIVKVLAPSVKEGAQITGGRLTLQVDGKDVEETSEQYARRCFGYMVPKLRFWNLENELGEPVALPCDIALDERDADKRLARQVDHLCEQDENVILSIYHEWRLVGYAKKADTDEGKDSATPSTTGPDASAEISKQELESQIPM